MPIHKTFNKDFFKVWSPRMAYILGFLFADGNIVATKRNTHFIAFYTGDYNLLYSIKEEINSNHKISERKSKTGIVYVLQIGSKELFEDLVKLGLTPNKSKRMQLPKIPENFYGDFIRGYFDGDGNVWSGYINKSRKNPNKILSVAFTCASKVFLKKLFILLKNMGLSGGSIIMIKNKNCSRLQYGTLDSLKLYNIMYNRIHKLFLERKKLVFERFLEMRP